MIRILPFAVMIAVATRGPAALALSGLPVLPPIPPPAADHSAATREASAVAPITLAMLEAQPEIATSDSRYWVSALKSTNQAIDLIGSNNLTTADEFFRISKFVSAADNRFRADRIRYELLLAASALGHHGAELELASAWDSMLSTLGRPMRTDFTGLAQKYPDFFQFDAAPEGVLFVLREPEKARAAAKSAEGNAEIKRIVDADQADRSGAWSNLTPEAATAVEARDHARNQRMRELIKGGALHTAADFANAALVMQHSTQFSGFQTAHELAVCSMLLGDRRIGRWLVAATYDRMLGSVGHDQRFGTQYSGMGGTETLVHVDTVGICDRERLALGSPTLEQAKIRK